VPMWNRRKTMQLFEVFAPQVIKDRDDVGSNPTANRPLIDVIEARLNRRAMLGGLAAGGAFAIYGGFGVSGQAVAADNPSSL
jgi:hypothetical protein